LCVQHAPDDAALRSRHNTCVRPFRPCWLKRTAFSGQSAQKSSEGIGAVVRKGDNALRERLNKALDALRKNGKMQEIAKPYLSDDFLALD